MPTAHLANATRSRTGWQPQKFLPCSALAIRIAGRTGRFTEARQALLAVLDQGLSPGHEREVWELLAHAAAAEADAYGLPAMEQGRARTLERIREAAAGLPHELPLFAAWARLLEAELARAERRDTPADWLAAAEALRVSEQPYPRALALLRAAEALAVAGERESASAAATTAAELAERQGDVHLAQLVRQLTERARLRPAEASEAAAALPAAAPESAGERSAPAFGLTPREQDVLRLVALGWSNRQIAAELYISPKTASVHVSNILAKLEVTGRGEAAAMALRLHLVPA